MHPILILAVCVLVLAGCGGSGGDAGGATGGGTPPPPSGSLGSRALPSGTVTVMAETTISAGQPATLLIEAPSLTAGATVTASVGSTFEAATAATVTSLGANRWRAALTLPSSLEAGTGVLVTVTLADGSVLESGIGDFLLL